MEVSPRAAAVVALVLVLAATGITDNGVVYCNARLGLCNVSSDALRACMPYVLSGPKQDTSKPKRSCCSALSAADFRCLCQYKNSLSKLGIDPNRAMQLPGRCNIKKDIPCKKGK